MSLQQIILRQWPQIAATAVLVLSGAAGAVPVPEIYSAAVAVADQSEEERLLGFRDALAAVIVKVSGSRDSINETGAAELLELAPALIQQYRYTASDELWAAFDSDSVDRAMRDAGLAVWGSNRPPVLLWLAVDWGGGRRGVVSADQDTELRQAIENVAASRGLPLILPLFDSTDRALMSFSDLWGGFSDKIAAASSRYSPGATLVGRASRGAGSRLFVRWELSMGGTSETWQGGLSAGLHRAADRLGERFASRGYATSSIVRIAVSGIGSLSDYARVSSYLEKLSVVRRLSVDRLAGDTVVYAVELQADPAQLSRILEFNEVLRPHEPTADQRLLADATHYRYGR